jgi:hypothetical protein
MTLAGIAKAGAPDSTGGEQFVNLGSGKPGEANGLGQTKPDGLGGGGFSGVYHCGRSLRHPLFRLNGPPQSKLNPLVKQSAPSAKQLQSPVKHIAGPVKQIALLPRPYSGKTLFHRSGDFLGFFIFAFVDLAFPPALPASDRLRLV